MSLKKPTVISTSGVLQELDSADTLEPGYTLVSSNTTLTVNSKVAADTSAGVLTLELPTAPVAGDRVRIKDYKRTFSVNNVTVDPGAKKVEGFLGAFILDVEGIEADMEFINNTQGWLVRFKF
jgi:hypothetical protein